MVSLAKPLFSFEPATLYTTLYMCCDLILLSLLLLADWLLYSGSCYMGKGKSVTDHSVIYIL